MILFPAIDLKDGKCVRLRRGNIQEVSVFNNNPVDQALTFESLGFSWLHIVDLNGAFAGRPMNAEVVTAICKNVGISVQLGGGIRDMATIEAWLDRGLHRVILGTAAVKDPDLVITACRNFPDRIVVGVDARSGYVAVDGWSETSEISDKDLVRRFEDTGVAAIIYTDIDRDGMMTGANVNATLEIADVVRIPVIASGGINSLSDILSLYRYRDRGIKGAIIGRALYEGNLDGQAALKAVDQK